VEELQLFFDDAAVAGDWLCAVQRSGSQSVGLAVRLDRGEFANPAFTQFDASLAQEAPILKEATDPFHMDTDRDGLDEMHKFERRPLYAELHLHNDALFRILGVHLKSKGIYNALEWSAWWARAEGNRKRLLAQCFRLRERFLNPFLSDDETADIPLLVCGDVNDGPGFDASEMRLRASGIERLMSSNWRPQLSLGNALYDSLDEDDRESLDFSSIETASFKDPIFDNVYQRVWIDHILYSTNHRGWISDAAVWETMTDGQAIYRKYPYASDHFPVTCVIELE
jgi:endonuclease/exonuclease/phosphatase family metal-dependent hydrolase